MRKLVCLMTTVWLTICMAGCTEQSADTAAEMPEIVLLCSRSYPPSDTEQGAHDLMTFWDRNGCYYMTGDETLCTMPFDALMEALAAGDERFTRLPQTCDMAELQEQYRLVCEIAENDAYELEYPEVLPSVEAEAVSWYGFYYENDGSLGHILLHANRCLTDIYANDERADAVYAWYQEAIRTDG